MCDTEEPPTKMSKFDEMSQTYTQEEEIEEGQEEWLSEEMLTDDDGTTTVEQEPNDSAVADNSQVNQDNTNLSSNDTSSKFDHSNIEEALNNMDSEQDDLPDELNTFLVMKKNNKTDSTPIAQDESDGNDTDDLLRLLEDDVKKTTKKVKMNISAKEREDKNRADTETSSDDDDFIFKGSSTKQLRIAQNALMRKKPATKAEPEESSDEDDDESMEKPVVRRVKVVRKPGNYAAKSTSKPQKPLSPINKQPVRVTRNSINASRTQTPAQTPKNPTQTPTQTPKNPTQAPAQTPKNPTQTPTQTPKNPTQTAKNLTQARSQTTRVYASTPLVNTKSPTLPAKKEPANQSAMKTIFKIGNDVTVKMNTASPAKQYTNKAIKKPILKQSPVPKPIEQPPVKHINKQTAVQKVVINKNFEKSEPSKVKLVPQESDEIINEDEFLEDEDFDLDEQFADESDTELDKRAIKQRIMKPEQLDEDMLTDGETDSENDSLFDDLSSTDSDLDDLFTLDIRDERAGDYLPLLGCRALELLLGEKKRVANRVETLKQSLESLSNSARIQANKIRSANANLAEIEDMIKAA